MALAVNSARQVNKKKALKYSLFFYLKSILWATTTKITAAAAAMMKAVPGTKGKASKVIRNMQKV